MLPAKVLKIKHMPKFFKSYFGVTINSTSNESVMDRGNKAFIYDSATATEKEKIYSKVSFSLDLSICGFDCITSMRMSLK